MDSPSSFLRPKEAAAVASISYKTFMSLVYRGQGPRVHIIGEKLKQKGRRRLLRIHRDDLKDWLDRQAEETPCSV
jgi:hypothetical protein